MYYCTGAKKIWIWSKRACGASICGMCFVFGEEEPGIAETFALYTAHNTSIETQILPKTKHMPQMEAPQALLEQIQIFFAPVQ